jgi:hypothetical protein
LASLLGSFKFFEGFLSDKIGSEVILFSFTRIPTVFYKL